MSIIEPIKSLIRRLGMFYVKRLCAREYSSQIVGFINERPIEFAFVFRQLVAFWPERVLDVGTGTTSLPHLMRNCGFHVTATDNVKDYWAAGMVNRHYHVIDDDITQSSLIGHFDTITCISVLEHIQDSQAAIKTMYKLLAPGGRLILTCPYNEKKYVHDVYKLSESAVTKKFSFVTQAFSRKELDLWQEELEFELIEQEYWQFFEGEYWTCGERVIPPRQVGVEEIHQLTCLLFRKPK